MAGRRPRPPADLVLDRSARRQPGARRADGFVTQAGDVRPARPPRHQGDRGRFPLCVEDRLRLRPQPDRERADPRAHDDRGSHAGATGTDRADLRGDRGGAACDRPPLQLDLDHPAASRLPARQGRDHGTGHARHDALQEARREDLDGDRLPVLAGKLPRDRARLRTRDLRGRDLRLGADPREADDRQSADDGRGVPAQRLCRPDGVVRTQRLVPRRDRPQRSPAQRPRHGRCDGRARADGRRRASRGDAVRQRRAHRQRRSDHDCAQPVDRWCRPWSRPLADRRGKGNRRGLQPAAGPPAPPLRRRARLHRVLRLPPGRDQQGHGRARAERLHRLGRPVSRDRPDWTSAAPTKRSFASTRSPGRAASPT